MENDAHLLQEYRTLWAEHGIDSVPFRLEDRRCITCGNEAARGDGDRHAPLALAGEPLAESEAQLLAKILEAMGTSRARVFFVPVASCDGCAAFARQELDAVAPAVVVALGALATKLVLGTTEATATLRGRLHPFPGRPGRAVMPTYSPAHLLREPAAKRDVWDDMKRVMAKLREKQ